MRGLPLLLALAGCSAVPPGAGGIVSTNPCADAILVRLVPGSRIAAISHYSQEPGASSLPLAVARRFRATAGTAEEVIGLAPSLVLTSSFTPPATRDAYARAGLKTLVLNSPTTVAASEAQVREIAAAVRASARGEAMVREVEAVSAASGPARGCAGSAQVFLPARGEDQSGAGSCGDPIRAKRRTIAPSALLFISGDLATGSGTLLDELLVRAGFRNAARDYGLAFTGRVPIERIAAHPPDVILSPGPSRTGELRRRVLARLGARTMEAAFPRALINCGGPSIPPALARLRAIRQGLS